MWVTFVWPRDRYKDEAQDIILWATEEEARGDPRLDALITEVEPGQPLRILRGDEPDYAYVHPTDGVRFELQDRQFRLAFRQSEYGGELMVIDDSDGCNLDDLHVYWTIRRLVEERDALVNLVRPPRGVFPHAR